MHMPNQRQWHIEQALRAAGPLGTVTFLHVQLFDDPLLPSLADNENENWYIKAREGHPPQAIAPAPQRLIHIRMYHPNWTTLDPARWAEHTAELLGNWKGARTTEGQRRDLWQDPYLAVSFANEQNLHYEAGDADPGHQYKYQSVVWYERVADWNLKALRRPDRYIRPGRWTPAPFRRFPRRRRVHHSRDPRDAARL
jgi:hypothetical protein